jgi:hypothetical protein
MGNRREYGRAIRRDSQGRDSRKGQGRDKWPRDTLNALLYLVRHACDRLCGLVVRVLGYRSGGPGSIPGTTRKKK